MTSPESRRLDLYNRLQEVLGTDPATTLMTYLPPVESPDLLTRAEFKTEVDELKTEVGARFDRLERRFDTAIEQVNKKIDRVLITVVGGLFVMVAALIGTGAFS